MGACQAFGSGSNPGRRTFLINMTETKDSLKKRFFYLIDFAISEYRNKNGNPYIKEYIELAFEISKKINYRVSKDVHLMVCKYCFSVRDSKNTKIRTITEIKNHKKQKYIKIHCLNCNNIKKINIK